ncbi:MAG: aldo/keto reductase [Phycisphaerales bacterium]|nr:aldo/keto reductase [Phycisphaerales bacterium]NNM26979.1 aldo/keto reductase [Phycisphaerales bacterium]
MDRRRLGRLDLTVSPIGFGAFKIGRNQKIKYADGYDLPDEAAVRTLVDGVVELGINLFDTAPAYGLSEERLGRALAARREDVVISTKAGETFENGVSQYDFTSSGLRRSVQRSLRRLQTDCVDILLIHSDGNDEAILTETDAVETLIDLRDAGLARAIGLSATSADGAALALAWADVLMVEYHPEATGIAPVLADAATAGVGVIVKKALASGRLDPRLAIPFALAPASVASVVIGGLDLAHVAANVRLAECAEGRDVPPRAEATPRPRREPA